MKAAKITPKDTSILIIDIQEKLMKVIPDSERISWNIRRIVEAANLFNVSILATEQNPNKLGHTIESIRRILKINAYPKMSFSCMSCSLLIDEISIKGTTNIILCGIETHVCIQQTAIDFINKGYNVFIILDATGSRMDIDKDTSLRRLISSGAIITSTESIIFELCEHADRKEFREISRIIQESF